MTDSELVQPEQQADANVHQSVSPSHSTLGRHFPKSVTAEPPIVLPPLAECNERRSRFTSEDLLDQVLRSETYGAPRVFDLFTLLAITLAFALLFAFLRLINPILGADLDRLAIAFGSFVTGIAIFQMMLWSGKKPRLASLVAGPVLLMLIFICLNLPRTDPAIFLFGLCLLIPGVPAGYLAGALVAGVFLLADTFRSLVVKEVACKAEADGDGIFTDSEG